ncbi:hypothetical protein NQ314_017574 [Rhamnusium bicolor]|uniref:Reverse transcriptase n=1 Tax=Rhamnusium bicolor TaxID=1586634 RepID=A0AAV8WT80_9CUCU|nr:hypothetical protein NQ314_017574 [Rhamnusium bicolor]
MQENDLSLAPEKTELIALMGRKKTAEMKVDVLGMHMPAQNKIRYLGVTMDKSLSCSHHIETAANKAEKASMALGKLMPRTKGPRTSTRRILNSVVNSIVLYAAPVWIDALKIEKNRKTLVKTQRSALIRMCGAYRTVSAAAMQVIASVSSIDLLAYERSYNFGADPKNKIQNRKWLLGRWQNRWDKIKEGRWTWELIRRVDKWLGRKHGELDFYLTQVLTGHGSFSTYLKRIQKAEDDICAQCNLIDSPEHTIFKCRRWDEIRQRSEPAIGEKIEKRNFIDIMIRSESGWSKLSRMCRAIITAKDTAEQRVPT